MTNPLSMIPPKVRLAVYALYAVGSVVMTYLSAKGVVGSDEVALYAGIGTVLGVTAASNVDLDTNQIGD